MHSAPTQLFNGRLDTSFQQFYVSSPDHLYDILVGATCAGQSNGLCGGAVEGGLFLTVGIHTGKVQMRVELHRAAPTPDPWWEEIVEASCSFFDTPINLCGWDGDYAELNMPAGQYRARFCATAFGETEKRERGTFTGEQYLLIFWPEARRADAVIKQTSPHAGYWHEVAARQASTTPVSAP